MQKRRRRLNKRAYRFGLLILIAILCIIVQFFFMPGWEDGNLNVNMPSEEGVHTQKDTDIQDSENAKKVQITN